MKNSPGKLNNVRASPFLRFPARAHIPLAVSTYDLRRKKKPVIPVGFSELKLILEESWKNTASPGRNVGIMKGAPAPLFCTSGARPGSIGDTNCKAAKKGKVGFTSRTSRSCVHVPLRQYLRLGDLTWLRETEEFCYVLKLGPHRFKVTSLSFSLSSVDVIIIKCYNGARSSRSDYTLTPPRLPEHLNFDASVYTLLYVFLRGALPPDTRDDLVNSNQAVIRVKDETKDLPM